MNNPNSWITSIPNINSTSICAIYVLNTTKEFFSGVLIHAVEQPRLWLVSAPDQNECGLCGTESSVLRNLSDALNWGSPTTM